MARNKHKKRNQGRFVGIPYSMMGTKQYLNLTSSEKALLFDLAYQYSGYNNGNLTACYTVLKKRNWASATLYRAYAGLVHAGFLVVTRQGMKIRGYATLLALTYQGIDEPPKGITYDLGIKPSQISLGFWCKAKASWEIQPTIKEPRKKCSTSN